MTMSTTRLLALRTALILLLLGTALSFTLFGDDEAGKEVAERARREYDPETEVEYGVDVSFPIHRESVSQNYPWLDHNQKLDSDVPVEHYGRPIQPLGDRQKFYEDFMNGCHEYYGKKAGACDQVERDRIKMSLRQPQSMQVSL